VFLLKRRAAYGTRLHLLRCVLYIAQYVVMSRVNGASMTKEFYTVEEIAELLRIRPGTVRNRVSQRRRDVPPSIVIGRRRLFPLADYEAWIKHRLFERIC
jgi:excisionase family DNA binding protein